MERSRNGRTLKGAFVAVTSLFFMWGFITVLVDALIPRLKEVFELTFLQAGLVQFAWFAAYGLLCIPGGNLISKIYKARMTKKVKKTQICQTHLRSDLDVITDFFGLIDN